MGILEEIQRMRQTGIADEEIISKLQEQGNSYRSISDAISQSKIKQAVEDPGNELQIPRPQTPSNVPQEQEQYQPPQEQEQYQLPQEPQNQPYQSQPNQEQGMQQSIMQSPPLQEENQEYFPNYDTQPQGQNATQYPSNQGYDYAQAQTLSSDTITEISEQIVSERLSDVRKKMEKISSFKTDLETKTEAMEERLKRIEKIIDVLQASVLRKVGDYVTNVEDLKHEMIETQKTFAKVLGSKHKITQKKR
ncbi:hypothetical protein J4416_01245 [Candidatus Pacearchaeota archaeon]|nr:hypothetical protein [Candidatus Pacearchaeota archaeon]